MLNKEQRVILRNFRLGEIFHLGPMKQNLEYIPGNKQNTIKIHIFRIRIS